jgi:hypothetical protein
MATDSFTGTDGTALATHDANWSAFNGTLAAQGGGVLITGGYAGMPTDFDSVGSFYSSSSSGNCQIVKKAGATFGSARARVCVRAGTDTYGYNVMLTNLTGDVFSELTLYNHTTYLVAATGLSINRTSDHTIRLRSTTNGGNQDIEAWIDGGQITWGTPTNNTIYSHSTTPLTTGSPGFWLSGSGSKSDSYFDDFDDLLGGGSPPVLMGQAIF